MKHKAIQLLLAYFAGAILAGTLSYYTHYIYAPIFWVVAISIVLIAFIITHSSFYR